MFNLNRICILGNIKEKMVLKIDKFPQPGETIRASQGNVTIDCKAVNQAIAASKLGNSVWFTGQISDEKQQTTIHKYFSKFKVNTGYLKKVNVAATKMEIVFQDKQQGVSRISLNDITNQKQKLDKLPLEYGSLIMGSSLLMLQQAIPEKINFLAAELAFKNNILVLLDLQNSERELEPDLLSYVNILCMDELQFKNICPDLCPLKCSEELIREQYLNQYPKMTVLIKLGTKGSRLIGPFQDIYMPGFQMFHKQIVVDNPVVSDEGAYDAFIVAFAMKYLEFFSQGDYKRRKNSTDDILKQYDSCLFYAETAYYYQLSQNKKEFPTQQQLLKFMSKYKPQ